MRGLHAKFPDSENKESEILNKTLSIKVMNIYIINTKLKSYCENLKTVLKTHALPASKKKDQVKSQKMKSFWKRVSNLRLGEFQDSGLFKSVK